MNTLAVLSLLAALSSGSLASPDGVTTKTPASEQTALEVPADLKARVGVAVSLGQEIYLRDKASAIGTDVLLSRVHASDRGNIAGYLTIREATAEGKPSGWWSVIFFTNETEPRVIHRVRVPMSPGQESDYHAVSPPEPVAGNTANLVRARQNALAAARPFEQPINPVVLPAEFAGETGILVLLIAGTSKPNMVVLGKHYRVLVSADGRTVKSVTPLSNGALELSAVVPNGARSKGLFATQLVTDYPVETHVFASLLVGLPIYVGTSRGIWCVDGASIRYVSREIPGSSESQPPPSD